jgi:hypothetical protein
MQQKNAAKTGLNPALTALYYPKIYFLKTLLVFAKYIETICQKSCRATFNQLLNYWNFMYPNNYVTPVK